MYSTMATDILLLLCTLYSETNVIIMQMQALLLYRGKNILSQASLRANTRSKNAVKMCCVLDWTGQLCDI